jgi:hypothetical protein
VFTELLKLGKACGLGFYPKVKKAGLAQENMVFLIPQSQ